MSRIHFLNVIEGDCNIIEHDTKHVTVIDVSNANNDIDTAEEKRKKESQERKEMIARYKMPADKKNYGQKKIPDNPITYLKKFNINNVFRFIITHPDMDHMDGIKDFYDTFKPTNTWDTDNTKELDLTSSFGPYSKEDWEYYLKIRDKKEVSRRTYYAGNEFDYFKGDDIKILCPTPELVKLANESSGDYHDLSYVLLYTPPKSNGGKWKFLFAGDSHDKTWEYIIENYKDEVENIDVLFAPHHGRDSDRNYDFLKILNPTVTLFGNAKTEHLAYSSYPNTRITNNQAGYVIMDISPSAIRFYVKNYEFAKDFRNDATKDRNWGEPEKNTSLDAWFLCNINAQ